MGDDGQRVDTAKFRDYLSLAVSTKDERERERLIELAVYWFLQFDREPSKPLQGGDQ
jgi:hypothetical protein